MNMFEELKAWADKWNIPYTISEYSIPDCIDIDFDSQTPVEPTFSYNKKTGDYAWYGGD